MGTLTTKERNKLPKSDFGIASERKFPMPDRSHAANAKSRASEMEKKGKISSATKDTIYAKANRILDNGKRGSKG